MTVTRKAYFSQTFRYCYHPLEKRRLSLTLAPIPMTCYISSANIACPKQYAQCRVSLCPLPASTNSSSCESVSVASISSRTPVFYPSSMPNSLIALFWQTISRRRSHPQSNQGWPNLPSKPSARPPGYALLYSALYPHFPLFRRCLSHSGHERCRRSRPLYIFGNKGREP